MGITPPKTMMIKDQFLFYIYFYLASFLKNFHLEGGSSCLHFLWTIHTQGGSG